jgi:signal transduction histidine kinase
MIAFLDILKNNFRKFTEKETEQQIKIAHDSAETAFLLLQDFLTWAKVQWGFIHVEPKIFRYGSICDDVQNNLKYYAKGKNIALHCKIPDDLEVKADIQIQKTVLRNLITNAIKFTPPRGKIEVFAEKKGNMVELAVTDSGIGIEAAVPAKPS